MEQGVFIEPSITWNFLWAGIACLAVGALFIVKGSVVEENYGKARALWGSDRIGKDETPPQAWILFWVGVIFCIAGIILLLIQPFQGADTGECLDERYAGQGIYRVVKSELVYQTKSATDAKGNYVRDENRKTVAQPVKPDHFVLHLEGKADASHPSDFTVVHCIIVPYERVTKNYKYAPQKPKKKVEPLALPVHAIKLEGGWWRFTNDR